MKYYLPLLAILAIIVLVSGCSNSNPSLPSPGGDGTASLDSIDSSSLGITSADLREDMFDGSDIRDLPRWLDDQVLIVLYDSTDANALYPIAKNMGLSLMEEIHLMWGTVYKMHIDSGEPVETVVAELQGKSEVKYAEPNLIMYPCSEPYYPNDPLFEYNGDPGYDPWDSPYDQWGPNMFGASLVWPHGNGTPDTVIAVLDTGCRYTHEDLENQVWINEDEIPGNGIDDDDNGYIDDWRSWDVMGDDNDIWDTYGHGTACSGVVAAEQDNDLGCTGVAPGIKVMPIRCDLSGGGGYTDTVIEGVQYAYDNGATAVSMSFRSYTESSIMHNTFIAAYDNGEGLLPVGAAGNENSSEDCWPADWPEVFEVGATCSFYEDGSRRNVTRLIPADYGWGSNWGDNLEIMAPGTLYITTNYNSDSSYYDGGNNGFFGGTSNACPCVAGCVGLLKSYFPDMNALELRSRLKETADDIHTPGHDSQSGYGRVNIWRAIFGSEPNEDIYDINGHVPIDAPDTWMYDNIFDISTAADYDFEDIFVIQADENGVLTVELDTITTGENLDLEIFTSPELLTPIGSGYTINNEDNPIETATAIAVEGESYYIRVFSPATYNCSNFRLRYDVEEFYWTLDWESIAPIFVFNGSDGVPLLKLDFETNLDITINDIRAYVTGTTPLSLVNNLRIYEDTNGSGNWEEMQDTLVDTALTTDLGINQHVFQGALGVCTKSDPLTMFLVADIGPNYLGYNVMFGAGLKSYKDISIDENAVLKDDPFPIFCDLITFGEDHDPPVWDSTTGIQDTYGGYKSAVIYWNNATDLLSEPTGYNVYMDENDPPDIATALKMEDVPFYNGSEYNHFYSIPDLTNDQTYFFLVRAEDASGNEEDNLTWLDATPSGTSDPENPNVIGELDLSGEAQEVWVHDKMAYVACNNGGLAIVDCHIPTAPVLVDTYPGSNCRAVQYYTQQDYVYIVNSDGLVILDPDASGGPAVIGSYGVYWAREVYVDNDICCIGYTDTILLLDVSDPTLPEYLGEYDIGGGWGQRIYGLALKDDYAFVPTRYSGLHIFDISDPTDPVEVKHLTFSDDLFEMDLWGDYAFISDRVDSLLHVVNISDPPNAFFAGGIDVGSGLGRGVAVRDGQYVYFGLDDNDLHSVRWDDLGSMEVKGTVVTDGPFGLFYDGEFLYSAEQGDGLKILL